MYQGVHILYGVLVYYTALITESHSSHINLDQDTAKIVSNLSIINIIFEAYTVFIHHIYLDLPDVHLHSVFGAIRPISLMWSPLTNLTYIIFDINFSLIAKFVITIWG